MSFETGNIVIKDNSYSIHHYDASWTSKNQKRYDKYRRKIINIFGNRIGKIITFPSFLLWQIRDNGLKKFFKKAIKKLKK